MTGTSLDGLDLALCRFNGLQAQQIELEAFETVPMPAALEAKIRLNIEPASSRIDNICELNAELAQWFAQASLSFLAQHADKQVDLIGSHGQTLYHLPPGMSSSPSSLQLGDGSMLAQLTGLTTVSNFRTADMAQGGQGAPLVPFLDRLLFAEPGKSVALQNIGGMGNVSWLGPAGEMMAFDTGPGNALIDGFAQALLGQPRDHNGDCAHQGQVQSELLNDWLQHPFFALQPPRSTGRETFGQQLLQQWLSECSQLSPQDALATITALSAHSIAEAYHQWLPVLPQQVYVSGGGVHNRTLMACLQQALPEAEIGSLAATGYSPDAKEALTFALLAYTAVLGICNNVPEITGAKRAVVMGQIAPADNWGSLQQKIWSTLCQAASGPPLNVEA